MDFVSVWKAVSIVLTGAFGILGLLTEFKDKHTHSVSRWGWLSLSGILISTVLGTIAQIKESRDDAKHALSLAEQSTTTLKEIEMLLSPVKVRIVSFWLVADCGGADFAKICASLESSKASELPSDYTIRIFNKRENIQPITETFASPTLEFVGDARTKVGAQRIRMSEWVGKKGRTKELHIFIEDDASFLVANDGSIRGLGDLDGKNLPLLILQEIMPTK